MAIRCWVVKRCFAAAEGAPEELMKQLDRDVTVIDPRAAEVEMEEDFKDARSMDDVERVAAERLEKRLKSGKDVYLSGIFEPYRWSHFLAASSAATQE